MRHLFALAIAMFLCAAPASAQDAPSLIVRFAQNEAVLSADARAQIDALAASVGASDSSLVLAGHAEASEPNAVHLSNNRASAVRDYLASKGVATFRLTTMAYGSERPVIGGALSQNRRVEITVGAASGW